MTESRHGAVQPALFASPGSRTGGPDGAALTVPGLEVLSDFVTEADAAQLLDAVDQAPWLEDLKRRVQHYGYRYDYRARTVRRDSWLGPLPTWLADLAQRIERRSSFEAVPDQAIVNEYLPGQGIAAHVDCEPCFGPVVATLSLGSDCQMDFRRIADGESVSIRLASRSLAILSAEARYAWSHGVAARKRDPQLGVIRGRRVSITFRTVQLS